jgi:hypothetical protein
MRLGATSGSAMIGTGVKATVNAGATLELAGSVSALSNGATRVIIMNNSQAAAGGVYVSGTNQEIGNLDGTGNTVIGSGASLTVNHIVQNALIIGGAASARSLVTIAASDYSGNSLAAASDVSVAGNLSLSSRIELGAMEPLSMPLGDLAPAGTLSIGGGGAGSLSSAAVPEPSAILLFFVGFSICVAHRWLARRSLRRTTLFE